jgi:hypothetical protein
VTSSGVEVQGPGWCLPGLDRRGGRYPLSVESPVMAMVDTLVPGVSTVTRLVRYYGLYWALADFAEEQDFDAAACRVVLRRAEVALAEVSVDYDTYRPAHGADRVSSLRSRGGTGDLAGIGPGSYSPRMWGFWSQYNGPSVALGTVAVEEGTLRSGRHACPLPVRRMFRPLLELVADRSLGQEDVPGFASLRLDNDDTPDLGPLGELFTATRGGRHVAGDWTGNDVTRRATLRILARAVQLNPAASGWVSALRHAVAYGDVVRTDPVLAVEGRAQAWRGVLLRHHSVGAWRRLWSRLVEQVRDAGGSLTRDGLYEWATAAVPSVTVREFVSGLPATVDRAGDPLAAEEQVLTDSGTTADVAVLLLGGMRLDQLGNTTLAAFLGRRARGRGQFLDPSWVAFRHAEHVDQPLAVLVRAFVDDMLAQSRRVALRKLRVDAHGQMTLFTKLHERNGRYFADQSEGSGNVGLRISQLGAIGEQLGLFTDADSLGVTPLGVDLLALPA